MLTWGKTRRHSSRTARKTQRGRCARDKAQARIIACNSHALGKTSSSMRDEEPSTRLINQGF